MASWFRNIFRVFYNRQLVGQDLRGNEYFVAEALTPGRRARRSVKLKEAKSGVQYTQDSVPVEWDRWLRGLRDQPPTLEELERSEQQRRQMQQRIHKSEKKEAVGNSVESSKEHSPLAQGTKATEHAAARSFRGEGDATEEAESTGKTFQPGSWKPF